MVFFGVPLAQLLPPPGAPGHALVPVFVDRAICHIIRHGLHEEGIFRMSPNKEALEQAKRALEEKGQEAFDFEERRVDPHVACGLLKWFFRKLDQCVLTTALYEEWLRAGEIEGEGERVEEVRRLVGRLPLTSQAVLERLVFLLAQVSGNENKNRMGAKSLGLVWGPNLLWVPGGDSSQVAAIQRVMESGSVASLVAAMVVNYATAFAEQRAAWADAESWASLWRSVVVSHRPLLSLAVVTLAGGRHSVWALDTDGTVFVMDPETGSVEGNWKARQDHPLQLKTIGSAVWGSSYSDLSSWSDNSGRARDTVRGFNYAIAVVGQTVWTSAEGFLRVWDPTPPARVVQEIPQARGHVTLALRKTGEHVWTGGTDRVVRVYDSRTYALVREVPTEHRRISAFAVCCERVWSAHEDGAILVWDPRSFEVVRELRLPDVQNVFHIETVGSTVWSCSRTGRVHIFDGASARHLAQAPHCHGDAVTAFLPIWNPRMARWQVWTASWDSSVCLWNLNQELTGMRAPAAPVAAPPQPSEAPLPAAAAAPSPSLRKPLILAPSTFLLTELPAAPSEYDTYFERPPVPNPRVRGPCEQGQGEEVWRQYAVTLEVDVEALVMAALVYTRAGAEGKGDMVRWLSERGVRVCGDLVEAPQELWGELEAALGGPVARAFYRVVKHLRPGKKVYLRRHPRHGGTLEHRHRMSCAEWQLAREAMTSPRTTLACPPTASVSADECAQLTPRTANLSLRPFGPDGLPKWSPAAR